MQRDPSRRLGARRDAEEVKLHRFFNGIDWDAVHRRELCPPKIGLQNIPKTGVPAEDIYGNFYLADTNKIMGWTFILE